MECQQPWNVLQLSDNPRLLRFIHCFAAFRFISLHIQKGFHRPFMPHRYSCPLFGTKNVQNIENKKNDADEHIKINNDINKTLLHPITSTPTE